MTTPILDSLTANDGGVFHVQTAHSEYVIDTEACTATRINTLGNNACDLDGTPIPYTHLECDVDAPLVMLWHKPGTGDVWRTSTTVLHIERMS